MAPRKKTRIQSRAASTPSGEAAEPVTEEVSTPAKNDAVDTSFLQDPWTDEQETSLFKGVIRWKPVGMHKHFRMIAISQHLRNHGYTSAKDDHTRIPGIWEKLGKLYNLDALDERENAIGHGFSDDVDPAKEPFYQFTLAEDEFGEMMFLRRLAPEGSSSPPSLPHQLLSESETVAQRQTTIEDTDDPRSSPASTHEQKSARATRAAKGTRTSQLQEVALLARRGRRGRRGSKASLGEGTEDEHKEDVEMEDVAEETKGEGKAASRITPKSTGGNTRRRKSGRRR